jgi:parallel beta-helix repeat protein
VRTRTFLAAVATAALLVGTFGASIVAAGDTAETTGTMILTQSTTLTADHAGNIRIAADGVTLDCAGHTVHGPGVEGFTSGIDFTNLRDVTIRRCVVTGFQYGGVSGYGDVNVRIEGNTLVANGGHGLDLYLASDGVIVGNTVTDYGTVGPSIGIVLTRSIGVTIQANVVSERTRAGIGIALLHGTNGSTVVGNRVTGTGLGISVQNSSGNVLSGNTASLNGDGFSVRGSSGNTLTRNTANGNISIGFQVDGRSSSNTLARNIANGNNDGFNIQAANRNVLSWNSARNNHRYGVFVGTGSSNNTIVYCTAVGSGKYDAYRVGSGTGNVWYRNTFGTKAGF